LGVVFVVAVVIDVIFSVVELLFVVNNDSREREELDLREVMNDSLLLLLLIFFSRLFLFILSTLEENIDAKRSLSRDISNVLDFSVDDACNGPREEEESSFRDPVAIFHDDDDGDDCFLGEKERNDNESDNVNGRQRNIIRASR
jgi:hypothetical protein